MEVRVITECEPSGNGARGRVLAAPRRSPNYSLTRRDIFIVRNHTEKEERIKHKHTYVCCTRKQTPHLVWTQVQTGAMRVSPLCALDPGLPPPPVLTFISPSLPLPIAVYHVLQRPRQSSAPGRRALGAGSSVGFCRRLPSCLLTFPCGVEFCFVTTPRFMYPS